VRTVYANLFHMTIDLIIIEIPRRKTLPQPAIDQRLHNQVSQRIANVCFSPIEGRSTLFICAVQEKIVPSTVCVREMLWRQCGRFEIMMLQLLWRSSTNILLTRQAEIVVERHMHCIMP